MSRKDYVLIAKVIAGLAIHIHDEGEMVNIEELISTLSFVLKEDNPKFNRDHFEAACWGAR